MANYMAGLLTAQYNSEGEQIFDPSTQEGGDEPVTSRRTLTGGIEVSGIDAGVYLAPTSDTSGGEDARRINLTISDIAAGNTKSKRLVLSGEYIINEPIIMQSGVSFELTHKTRITVPEAFTTSLTVSLGSTTATLVLADANASRVKKSYYLSGAGIDDRTRVSAVTGTTVTLSLPATGNGVIVVTAYPVFNLIDIDGVASDFAICCPSGWATLDGNLAAQPNVWLAAHDDDGSGINIRNCYNYQISGLRCVNNHYHGIFVKTSNGGTGAGQKSSITRMQFVNNGIRGLHGRASGTVSDWPGMDDLWIDDIYLERNGRMWPYVQGADGYDAQNSGVFLHVGGMRRCNIGNIVAKNEWGQALQIIGDDSTTYTGWSEHNKIGTLSADNCARAVYIYRGAKSLKIDHVDATCLFLRSNNGASCNTSTVREYPVRSLETGDTKYMVVCDMVLPSALSASDLAGIRQGMYVLMSVNATGNLIEGNIIADWNVATRTATVWAYADPLGTTNDVAAGLCASQTPSGSGSLTLNGTQTTAGVSSYSISRKISITSAGNASAVTFTLTGTSWDDSALEETLTGPNAGTVWSTRLFKTVSQIDVSAGTGVAITIGTGKARPITTTVADGSICIRGSRDGVVALMHSGAESGHIEGVTIDSLFSEGNPGYPIKSSTSSSGFVARNIVVGSLRAKKTQYVFSFDDAEAVSIGSIYCEDIGRAYNADDGTSFGRIIGTKGFYCGLFVHKQSAEYPLTGQLINIGATSRDVRIGKFLSSGSGSAHLRNDSTNNITIDDPRKFADSSQLTTGGGHLIGAGTIRVLNAV